MPASLVDNIYADCPVRDERRLQQALEQADLHQAALALPAGYNTQLGFAGVELSSGQRQRLLIARALYMQPDLLIWMNRRRIWTATRATPSSKRLSRCRSPA